MRTLTMWALGLLGVAVAGGIWVVLAFRGAPDSAFPAIPFSFLGLIGLILALIASLLAITRAAKRHQWGWLAGLALGFLLPLPLGFAATIPLIGVYTDADLQPYLLIFAGVLLTPVTALVYSVQHDGHGRVGQ